MIFYRSHDGFQTFPIKQTAQLQCRAKWSFDASFPFLDGICAGVYDGCKHSLTYFQALPYGMIFYRLHDGFQTFPIKQIEQLQCRTRWSFDASFPFLDGICAGVYDGCKHGLAYVQAFP